MIRWELLDRAPTPDGASELTLHRRGAELSIRVDGRELMNSRMHGSEEAMARMACADLGPRAHVLIGGLGLGFTLAAACAALAPTATITVVELMGAVIRWNQGDVGALAGHPLQDPRVTVVRGDVRKQLGGDQSCDAVLLDVDNGPGGLTQASNEWLYGPAGLGRLRRTLRPGGVAAIWSAQADPGFTQRLGATGLHATTHTVRARANGKGPRHTIWLGVAPG